MEQATITPPRLAERALLGRGPALRVPVRYIHDPAHDSWSFHIEIPPISGAGCGCREVAERSAFAALRRHLSARLRPWSDGEHVGYITVTLGPGVEDARKEPTVAPVPRRSFGFHSHVSRLAGGG